MCCGLDRLSHRAMGWFGRNVNETSTKATVSHIVTCYGYRRKEDEALSQIHEETYLPEYYYRGKKVKQPIGRNFLNEKIIKMYNVMTSATSFSRLNKKLSSHPAVKKANDQIAATVFCRRDFIISFEKSQFLKAMKVVKGAAAIAICALAVGAAIVASKSN